MRRIALVVAVFGAFSGCAHAAGAAKKDVCTIDCRDYYKACVQAHSLSACSSELNLCMKHCRKK